FAAALVLMVGLAFNNGYAVLMHTAEGAPAQTPLWIISIVAAACALVGLVGLVLTVQTGYARWGARGAVSVLGALVVVCLLAAMFMALPYMIVMLGAPGMAILVLSLIMATPPEYRSPAWDRSTKATIAAGFT